MCCAVVGCGFDLLDSCCRVLLVWVLKCVWICFVVRLVVVFGLLFVKVGLGLFYLIVDFAALLRELVAVGMIWLLLCVIALLFDADWFRVGITLFVGFRFRC